MWDYENGFLAGLIATILEDYGRRMVKVKFGSNNIVDTVSWPMLLDGPCSNARTVNLTVHPTITGSCIGFINNS